MSDLSEILLGAVMSKVERGAENAQPELSPDEQVQRLTELLESFDQPHAFSKGQLVEWKEGMRNRNQKYGEPLIVVEVLSEPVIDERQECDSVYFREPLDIILGKIDRDGDFLTFYHDSRRVKPYTKKDQTK